MIPSDVNQFITAYDSADAAGRAKILQEQRAQCVKSFLCLLEHVSKDQTIQYVLVLIDDMLQVCIFLSQPSLFQKIEKYELSQN